MLQKHTYISNTTKSTDSDEVISTPIPWCNLCHRSPQLRSQINCSWTFQPEVLATFLGMHWRSASTQKGAKKRCQEAILREAKYFLSDQWSVGFVFIGEFFWRVLGILFWKRDFIHFVHGLHFLHVRLSF